MAEERGNSYLVALVFTTPPSNVIRHRNELSRSSQDLDALRTKVCLSWMGCSDEPSTIDFRFTTPDQRPRILQPWRRLALVWRDQEIELRGYLDVYMTMLL